jgi:hypothetical protein
MGVPSTGRLIGLLNCRLGGPWREIEVLVDEDFKPKYPLASRGLNRFGNGIRP